MYFFFFFYTISHVFDNVLTFCNNIVSKKEKWWKFQYKGLQKKTYSDIYLHADSHRCPSQKIGLLHSLAKPLVRRITTCHVHLGFLYTPGLCVSTKKRNQGESPLPTVANQRKRLFRSMRANSKRYRERS